MGAHHLHLYSCMTVPCSQSHACTLPNLQWPYHTKTRGWSQASGTATSRLSPSNWVRQRHQLLTHAHLFGAIACDEWLQRSVKGSIARSGSCPKHRESTCSVRLSAPHVHRMMQTALQMYHSVLQITSQTQGGRMCDHFYQDVICMAICWIPQRQATC